MAQLQTSTTKLIPRNVLFGNPSKASPQLSPDGKRIAYLAPYNNILNVWLGDFGSEQYTVVSQDKERGIRNFFWAYTNEHILYMQDSQGDEDWHLYVVDLDTLKTRDLTPFDKIQAQIISRNKQRPEELLVAINKDDPRLHDVYHLDIVTGELKLIEKNPGNVAGWLADRQLKVKCAMAATDDGGMDLLLRLKEDSEWTSFLHWTSEDALNSHPLGYSAKGDILYLVDSRNENAGQLMALNVKEKTFSKIIGDEEYDVSGVMVHPDSYELQAVAFVKARNEWVVLDNSIAEDFKQLSVIHSGDFVVSSRNQDDSIWLVSYTCDNGPVHYYMYNRKSKKETRLFVNRPELLNYDLAEMEPIEFQSRDGLTIRGYLTCPLGVERKDLPLVLNVHGGPNVRDVWGYDPEAQWLANRGYACLQINYRGSTGYGKQFVNAGDREWGGKMHDDLIDAVNWAVHQGLADKKRICIYGGSYGGYAALVGATFTPDVFCCAVDVVGPSNLITMIKSIPAYWSTYLAIEYKRVGHPEKDDAFLKSRSPLFKVDRIKAPILIAHGKNDPRVKLSESEQIIEAMKSKNIPYEFLLFEDEGHGFAKPENRMKFYAAAEQFLAKHLGGQFEEIGT